MLVYLVKTKLLEISHEDEQVIPLSGVVIMEEETTQELVTKVERELSNLRRTLLENGRGVCFRLK